MDAHLQSSAARGGRKDKTGRKRKRGCLNVEGLGQGHSRPAVDVDVDVDVDGRVVARPRGLYEMQNAPAVAVAVENCG